MVKIHIEGGFYGICTLARKMTSFCQSKNVIVLRIWIRIGVRVWVRVRIRLEVSGNTFSGQTYFRAIVIDPVLYFSVERNSVNKTLFYNYVMFQSTAYIDSGNSRCTTEIQLNRNLKKLLSTFPCFSPCDRARML